jgi:hypothetical protein
MAAVLLTSFEMCVGRTVESIQRCLLSVQSNMGVVLKHPAREMPSDGLDDMVRFASLQQPRHDRVPQVMEP